ncbi:MAG: ArnT family glycosyltransferase [Kineosporiaceae bacterium]|jgi:hypothetical protein
MTTVAPRPARPAGEADDAQVDVLGTGDASGAGSAAGASRGTAVRRQLAGLLRERARSRTGTAAAAAVIAVVAVAARVYALDDVGFNSDEAVYAGQGASIGGDPTTLPYFPVFRAHPLLFQSTISVVYEVFGRSDLAARLTAVVFGLLTVWVTYHLGKEIHTRAGGLLAALLLALMPYHVVVSRQVLLDGPQTLFSTAALYGLARYSRRRQDLWLHLGAVALGASVIAKETSVILLGAVFAYFALTPTIRTGPRRIATSLTIFALVVAAYPLSLRLAGASGTGGAFLTYQLFRRSNHPLTFYPTVVPPALGLGVLVAAVAGLWLRRGRFGWRDALLWSWVLVPCAFFELFPVKGYQYLLPIAAPMAVLAATTLLDWPHAVRRRGRHVPAWLPAAAVAAVVVTLVVPTVRFVVPAQRSTFLAGTGGVQGGRELGGWIDRHVPEGVTILTIGPSMANIIQWYGHRAARGLSVSPNPLYRNPVYDPIANPDLAIRRNQVQYVVWDTFSAQRSPHFAESLQRYVDRYSGREVHRQSARVDKDGRQVQTPLIIVYEVRP